MTHLIARAWTTGAGDQCALYSAPSGSPSWRAVRAMVACAALALLSACATPLSRPAVDNRVRDASTAQPLVIRTADGVLEDAHARALLRRTAQTPERAELLIRMTQLQQGLTGRLLTADNRAKLLVDGPAAYQAMFEAIRAARHHVHLETYILEDSEIGQKLADLLIERADHGVEVRVTYDGIGSLDTSESYFERLRNHGVQLYEYGPPDPTKDLRLWRINNRHHRKILIVDGRIAFTGGINISDVYRSSSFRKFFGRNRDEVRKRKEKMAWRDTQIEFAGPGVAELQQLFVDLWNEQSQHQINPDGGYFPSQNAQGNDFIQIVDSAGGDNEVRIYDVVHAAVSRARERIWITQAYFSPDDALVRDLVEAARRGVDVRMILPGFTDAPIVMYAARSNYDRLLAAGIKIYERSDTVLHAKTMTVDGIWSTVGSSNFDYRSFLHNNEANAVILGPDFAQRMEQLFQRDLEHCEQIQTAQWRQRPWADRLREQFSRMFRYWF